MKTKKKVLVLVSVLLALCTLASVIWVASAKDEATIPGYSITGTYQYGSFDASALKIQYKDGDSAPVDVKNLFDTSFVKEGVLNGILTNEAVSFCLNRLSYEGGKTYRRVVSDVVDGKTKTEFTDIRVLNDLNVGTYEIKVSYKNGEDTFVVTGTFTVAAKKVTANSRDIYAIVASYEESGSLEYYKKAIVANETEAAVLPDAIAYYNAYAKIEKAEDKKALYDALQAEYDKVVAAYQTAYASYSTAKYEVYAAVVAAAKKNGELDASEKTALMEAYAKILLNSEKTESTDNPFEGSLLETAYNDYCNYVKAFKAYVSFCAGKSIQISAIEDNSKAYKKYVESFAESFVFDTEWALDENVVALDLALPFEPALPGGFISYNALEKAYNGAGQYPNLILLQYVEVSNRYKNLRNMYSYEAFTGRQSGSTGTDSSVSVIPADLNEFYDFGTAEKAYVAYHVLDENGKEITNTAIHGGTYKFTLAFEGNYKGTLSGLSFAITTSDITVKEGSTPKQSKVYDGKAFNVYEKISSLSFNSICQINTEYACVKKESGKVEKGAAVCENYGAFSLLTPDAVLSCKVLKDDGKGNYKEVEGNQAIDAGTYQLVYSLVEDGSADDFRLVDKDGKTVKTVTVDLVIEPRAVFPYVNVIGVTHGDKTADVIAKATAPIVSGFNGDITEIMNVDIANAKVMDPNDPSNTLTKNAKLEVGETYELRIPVTLIDKENFVLDDLKVSEEEGANYIYVQFSVGKKEISVDWKFYKNKQEATYTGEGLLGNITASFKGIDGVAHDLQVLCAEGEMIHAGTYTLSVALSEEDAKYYTLPLNYTTTYTVNPIVVTPKLVIKDVLNQPANPIYGEDSVADYFYDKYDIYFLNALQADMVVALTDKDADYSGARFTFDVKFIALETEEDYRRFYVENDWSVVTAGKQYGLVTFTSKTVDYVIADGADEFKYEYIVEPREMDASAIQLDDETTYTFNEKEQTAVYQIIDELLGDKKLKEGRDYTVFYKNNTNAGTATMVVSFIGNYTGVANVEFTIVPKTITESDITAPDVTYNTQEQTPDIVVKDGKTVLVKDRDYTVAFENSKDVSTAAKKAKVTVTYIGNYAGEGTADFKVNQKTLTEAEITVEEVTFNGEKQTPAVVVKDGDLTLGEDDYDVEYSNNTNAGTATVTVTFKGNYAGEQIAEFEIAAKTVEDAEITVEDVTFNGEKQTPAVVVKDGAVTLGEDDYDVEYSNNTNAGTATVTVTFKGNYAGTDSETFTIEKKDVSLSDANTTFEEVIYTGSQVTPVPTIVVDALTLAETDYVITYVNNVAVGTATATISPATDGNYTFEPFEVEFAIDSKELTNATVTVSDVTYNGEKQTPAVVVKDGEVTLVEGTDYTVEYSNNTNAGAATATVTYIGNYTGTQEKNFNIKAATVNNPTVLVDKVTYNGKAQTPAVVVKDGAVTLGKDDYDVEYSNNTHAGTATVTVTFKGNYKGTATETFAITKKAISLNLTLPNYVYTGEVITPTPVISAEGFTLVSDSDYVITYHNNVNIGSATATITEKINGNFTFNPCNVTFTITPKTITNSDITVSDVTYNGKAQTPAVVVKDGNRVLVNDVDYTVAYSNNTNAGVATATVTYKGNYAGTGSKNFNVNKLAYTQEELAKIQFNSDAFAYNGEKRMIEVTGTLPEGVTVSYNTTGYTEIGVYTVIATFTVDNNHAAIAPMSATLEIRVASRDNAEKTEPSQTEKPATEQKKPEIIVEYEKGFASDIVLKVEVIATSKVKDKQEAEELLINYDEKLEADEAISKIYEVKLVQIDEKGNAKEINVSDLANGATIIVKMEIPAELLKSGKLTRVLHVHAADDITTLVPAAEGTKAADLKVGEYIIEDGYLVTRINRLSEFAFIYEKECITHWILLAELIVFVALAVVAWFVFKKKKMDLSVLIACVVYTAAFAVTAFFGRCGICVAMTIACGGALIAALVLFLCGKDSDTPESQPKGEAVSAKDAE